MITYFKILFILFVLSFSSSFTNPFSNSTEKEKLIVTVSGIKKSEGKVLIAVYDSAEKYMKDRFAEAKAEVVSTGELEVLLEIPHGKYAISIFHDVNNDSELNTNFLGIPKEPYGFSNNPNSRFGPPDFEDASFDFNRQDQEIMIELR